MKKPALIIGSLIILVLVLSVVRIFISNQVSTSGVVLSAIQTEAASVKTENTILAEKLYTESALTNIDSEAENLGFVTPKSDFVLSGQVSVAFKQ
jgi:Na+-transporting NADH:ubiquinone oxidoreductase subunit NqrC